MQEEGELFALTAHVDLEMQIIGGDGLCANILKRHKSS